MITKDLNSTDKLKTKSNVCEAEYVDRVNNPDLALFKVLLFMLYIILYLQQHYMGFSQIMLNYNVTQKSTPYNIIFRVYNITDNIYWRAFLSSQCCRLGKRECTLWLPPGELSRFSIKKQSCCISTEESRGSMRACVYLCGIHYILCWYSTVRERCFFYFYSLCNVHDIRLNITKNLFYSATVATAFLFDVE